LVITNNTQLKTVLPFALFIQSSLVIIVQVITYKNCSFETYLLRCEPKRIH